MATFLFWNLNRLGLEAQVANLAKDRNADLVILAEYTGGVNSTLDSLNESNPVPFHYVGDHKSRLTLFSRFSPSFFEPRRDDARVSIKTLALPEKHEITLAMAHMPSKMYESDSDQQFEFTRLISEITKIEDLRGHRRTVLIGDLNANPFEAAIVAAGGMNATMSRHIASRGERIVKGKRYPFFYNPMWNFFGDFRGPVCGSYYYSTNTHVNYHWNIFDQVLVRPDLIEFLPTSPLEIVSEIGSMSLLSKRGTPNRNFTSDHLPIVFRLNI